jgi:hypothetical protein
MISLEYWDSRRGVIYSRVGGWSIGGAVTCRGKDLLHELLPHYSYVQILVFSLTGKLISRNLADWIESGYATISYPDHRIWCNQIGTLCGELEASPVAAAAAGCLAADSTIYGSRPVRAGMQFIQDALSRRQAGDTVEQIIEAHLRKQRGVMNITGYTRPIAIGDERVPVLRDRARQLGMEAGPHELLSREIDRYLDEKYDERINVNGIVSAIFADHGLTPDDGYHICAVGVTAGVMACYLDYLNQPADSFLPLRCDDIDYQGVAPRELPERFSKPRSI